MKTLYRDNKGLHRWLFACGAVLVLFYLFRGNRAAVNFWVYSVTLPFEQFLGRACAALPFSVAELLYVLAAVTAVVLLVLMVRYLIKSRQKGRAAYRCALFVLDLFLTVYAAFSLLWGADYYGYENSLNVHIRHLREKIEPDPGHPQWLLTVRGIGYRLTGEV